MVSFYQNVIQQDPRFATVTRVSDLNLLEPVTRARVEAIITAARHAGIPLLVWETFRSKERQAALYAQGVTKLQTVGVHHYGLAADLVRDVQGEPSWKGRFTFLEPLARDHALIWGGNWGKKGVKPQFYDPYHVQRCTVARQKTLFAGTWYPDETYDPYA
jgi:hypothetical protein